MLAQKAINVVTVIGGHQDGRHRHNHQQSDSGFEKGPHLGFCIALEIGSCQYHRHTTDCRYAPRPANLHQNGKIEDLSSSETEARKDGLKVRTDTTQPPAGSVTKNGATIAQTV